MRKDIVRTNRTLAPIACAVWMVIATSAHAQAPPAAKPAPAAAKPAAPAGAKPTAGKCAANAKAEAGDMSEGTYADVQSAMELLAKQKYDEAIEKLSKIADKGSAYEKSVVNYNLGFAYSSKNDHKGAVQAFAKALSFNALPQSQREQLQYNLGQLYIVVGQYDDGIKTLQDYIANACGTVPAEAHIFLANALTERKRYSEALPQIDLALAKVKEPKELWLQMKLAISFEQKDYKGCADALVALIGVEPLQRLYDDGPAVQSRIADARFNGQGAHAGR
jgi:tetratricopeptide (TPR) repeat protein